MKIPRVFVSFDYDRDEKYRTFFVSQSKNDRAPFDFANRSVYEPWALNERKEKCKNRMKTCDVVIVLCGTDTYHCNWVKAEIKMANELNLPIYWIKIFPNKTCPRPDWLRWYYDWNRDNISAILDSVSK